MNETKRLCKVISLAVLQPAGYLCNACGYANAYFQMQCSSCRLHAPLASAASSSLSCLSISSANRFFSAFLSRIIVISSRLGLFTPSPLLNGEPFGVLNAAGENDAKEGIFLSLPPSAIGEFAGVDAWLSKPGNVCGLLVRPFGVGVAGKESVAILLP